jgi:Flp pilus assembly protein TadD
MALVAYARFHDRLGHVDEATQLYERALAAAPENALVLNDLGLFRARRGEWDLALEALNKAVQFDQKNARYRNNLAAVLVQTGRVEEAVAVLRVVHPEPVAQYNIGYLLYLQRDFDRATWHFRQASQQAPTFTAAREMLEQIEQSRQELGRADAGSRRDGLRTAGAGPSPSQAGARTAALGRAVPTRAAGEGVVWPPDRPDGLPRKLPAVQ